MQAPEALLSAAPKRPVLDDRRRRKYDYVAPERMPRPPLQNGGPYINPRDTTPVSFEEGRDLAALAVAGNVCARDRLVASCEGMVIIWVRRYARAVPHLYDELLADSRMALVESVATYDPERGMKFSSFAMFRVRNLCFETVRAMRWAVNLPILRNPDKAKKYGGGTRSQSTTIVGNDGEEREMVFPAWDPSPDFLLHERLWELVRTVLTERERDVLESHLQREQTLEEIGERHSVSRERIRQIEEKALQKLRAKLERAPRPVTRKPRKPMRKENS